MKTYIKPSGVEVEVNPNSFELAASMGWKVKGEEGPTEEEITVVREKYEEITGKKPHHKLGIDKMMQVIEEA